MYMSSGSLGVPVCAPVPEWESKYSSTDVNCVLTRGQLQNDHALPPIRESWQRVERRPLYRPGRLLVRYLMKPAVVSLTPLASVLNGLNTLVCAKSEILGSASRRM